MSQAVKNAPLNHQIVPVGAGAFRDLLHHAQNHVLGEDVREECQDGDAEYFGALNDVAGDCLG